MNKYVIMGAQGCGKGTQAKLLEENYDLVHISVGDIFRWNIQHHTKLGARVNRIVAAGKLVSDDIVAEIVHSRLGSHDWNYGFVLDGFPRNRAQAEIFLESYDIDAVINIVVSDEITCSASSRGASAPPAASTTTSSIIVPRSKIAATCAAAPWWPAPTTRTRPSVPVCGISTRPPSRCWSFSPVRN